MVDVISVYFTLVLVKARFRRTAVGALASWSAEL